MTQNHEKQGHDQALLDLMRTHELSAADTYFKPNAKIWSNRKRICNATYIPKHKNRRLTKLDYLLVSQRWRCSVTASTTKCREAFHRFGTTSDHGLLISVEWAWRLRVSRSQPQYDFQLMTPAKWQEFDPCSLCLRHGVQKKSSRDDPSMYRVLGLLNHAYKILIVCLLNRIPRPTGSSPNGKQGSATSEGVVITSYY